MIKSGYRTTLSDAIPAALDRGYAKATASLDQKIERVRERDPQSPKIQEYQAQRDLLRKECDLAAAVQCADLVIEAVTEQLPVKQQVFTTIDKHAPAHAILASNTSALSIDTLAAGTTRPAQFIGMHF